jgi:endo-1,4-beta-mannosidase
MTKQITLTGNGAFTVGCNYWASHAGIQMWSDWREDVVAADFKQLSENGLEVLRVFPLWPDFQPLTQLYGGAGVPMELRFGECSLPHTEAGQNGVSEDAMEHFVKMADLAETYNLKLVVGLLTGWMSGRLFVPPAFERLNVLTDPMVRRWQVRFVQYFVKKLKAHPAIMAWDLGNECNCMGVVQDQYEAWDWASAIANAIRVEDQSRPVVSGMHSLKLSRDDKWRIQDQGELTDVLTTHPYPIFTPYCNQDPVNTMRNGLHATAESRMYSDISGKPCFAEELGTLGPMVCSEEIAADYLRSALFSLWANDCKAMLWWCAYDQKHLEYAPYQWNAFERELGLVRENREVKPVLKEIKSFIDFVNGSNLELPVRKVDAVCILTTNQDHWGAAYSSYILAKQAGFDIEFQYSEQPLRESDIYLVPSFTSGQCLSRELWLQLIEKAKEGATVCLSHDSGFIGPFNEPLGLELITREKGGPIHFSMNEHDYTVPVEFKLNVKATTAEVLATDSDGMPVFTVNHIGKGAIYFLGVPVEQFASNTKGVFMDAEEQALHLFYKAVAKEAIANRVVRKVHPFMGCTEHMLSDSECYSILINYSPDMIQDILEIKSGWKINHVLYGNLMDGTTVQIGPNDAVVLKLSCD